MLSDKGIFFPDAKPQDTPNPYPLPNMYHNPDFPKPPRPNFTVQEEFIETTRRVNETLDRVLHMEDRIRKTLDSFTSTISADNVAFKNLCVTTYNQFAATVHAEVNSFEAEITNAYKAFGESVKTDWENFTTNFAAFKEDVNARIAAFESSFTTALNDYKAELNGTYDAFRNDIEARLTQHDSEHVQAFNDYVASVNNRLANMSATLNERYAEFVTSINQTVTTFKTEWSEEIAARLDGQDAIINDTRLYFKTNLAASVQNVITSMSESGELQDMLGDALLGVVSGYPVNVQSFGAKGDGVTDDSRAIQAAIASLPKENAVLFFPAGLYIHGDGNTTGASYAVKPDTDKTPDITGEVETYNIGRDIRFVFEGFKNLTIVGYGARIQSHDGNGETRNNAIFLFDNCENVTIEGLTIDGRRQERGIFLSDYCPTADMELSRDNIYIQQCENVLIRDVVSINAALDGLQISGHTGIGCENIRVENSRFCNNHRQGISVCGCEGIVIYATECSLNGTKGDGFEGIAPKAGIDLESPSATKPNNNVRIVGCLFRDNGTQNVVSSYNTNDVVIDDCTFDGSMLNVFKDNKQARVHNCRFIDCRVSSVLAEIRDCEFLWNSRGIESPVYVIDRATADGDYPERVVIEGNTFTFNHENATTAASNFAVGLRLMGEICFNNNTVIDAASVVGSEFVALFLHCREVCGNRFVRKTEFINGKATSVQPFTLVNAESNYSREGNTFEGYTLSDYADVINTQMRSDYSLTRETKLTGGSNRFYSIVPFDGEREIVLTYLNHRERITISLWGTHVEHVIEYNGGSDYVQNGKLVTLYKGVNGEFFMLAHKNAVATVKYTASSSARIGSLTNILPEYVVGWGGDTSSLTEIEVTEPSTGGGETSGGACIYKRVKLEDNKTYRFINPNNMSGRLDNTDAKITIYENGCGVTEVFFGKDWDSTFYLVARKVAKSTSPYANPPEIYNWDGCTIKSGVSHATVEYPAFLELTEEFENEPMEWENYLVTPTE